MCQAELKDCKFREPLAGKAVGNPEPSSENREGAETRHRLCMRCGDHIPLKRYKNAKNVIKITTAYEMNLENLLNIHKGIVHPYMKI